MWKSVEVEHDKYKRRRKKRLTPTSQQGMNKETPYKDTKYVTNYKVYPLPDYTLEQPCPFCDYIGPNVSATEWHLVKVHIL